MAEQPEQTSLLSMNFGFLKDKLGKLKENTTGLVTAAKNSIVKGTNTLFQEAKTSLVGEGLKEQKELMGIYHPTTCADFTVPIFEQVSFMHFPEEPLRQKYGEILKAEHTINYRVWNVGEYAFDYRCFNDQVSEYVSVGYPNPPLLDLFLVAKEISNWIDANPGNTAFVFCQKTKSRSCLVLGCLMYYRGLCRLPAEGVAEVCTKLGVSEHIVLDACCSVYAGYFDLIFSRLTLNQRKVRILKIVVNELPKVGLRLEHRGISTEDAPSRPYIQLFSKEKLIFSSLTKA